VDRDVEIDAKRQAELGRLLSAASGYEVRRADGKKLGYLDHVRYQGHTDYPDEIVIRRRRPWPRVFALPLAAVGGVDARAQTVTLRSSS
jgi:hypothetical protein